MAECDQMITTEYSGIEKRKYDRMVFPAAKRPIFRARGEILEIKDVSRGGLKFCHKDGKIKIQGWVKGTVDLTDGTCVDLEGIVVRVEKMDMGLSFIGDLEDDVYRQITTTGQVTVN